MRILIAEDEKSLRLALEDELREAGFRIDVAASGEEAIEKLADSEYDLVVCDLIMDGIGGKEVLEHVKARHPGTAFVLMTAHATVQSAIEILKRGAMDYLRKPFEIEELLKIIGQVDETIRLRGKRAGNGEAWPGSRSFGNMFGRSRAIRETFQLASVVAGTDAAVMIIGETGTGKNMLAEAIHYESARRNHPFITVSCAALSRELLESELFGHEKGAFTGSIRQKKGRFELAHKGTLFLNEVDDIPMETQARLLNFIQTGKFERVGGENALHADVRIIAATKKDLLKQVELGLFRQDLYYRLNVLQIRLPPLRERPEDVPMLVEFFLRKYSPERKLNVSGEIMDILKGYPWEGNVRELEQVVERLVLLNRDGAVERSALPAAIIDAAERAPGFGWGRSSLHEYLDQMEETLLKDALGKCGGNKRDTAALLKIPLPTLKSKLAKFRLGKPDDGDPGEQ
jgi:DNA-binding NtrC family response regulator